MSLKYRPEIDGLRAIAVVAVVLYHAEFVFLGVNPFKGGFIGVDIFFVISGYLITSIIVREMSEGKFSFTSFYERRARRILPALFTVILTSIPFALIYMLPKAMKEYAGSVLSALAFGSNIWFWQEDSYTAELSALKPFLHTWTLSVEEQFYVIFPIVLLLLWRFARRYITSIFVLVFLFSLQLAHSGSANYVDATFYLLPTRGWELLAGAILAKLELEKGRPNHPFLDVIMPAVGLFLICNAIFFFNDKMRHPSYITLFPVLGTMLIIWFSKRGKLITYTLGSKPLVAVGLISYSFYLWHFPIFAFSKIKDSTYSQYDKVEWIALAVVLSVTSYFLIEKPLRKSHLLSLKHFIAILMTAIIVITASMSYMYFYAVKVRIDDAAFNIESEKEKRFLYIQEICGPLGWADCYKPQESKKNVLVIGDSMVPDAVNIMNEQYPDIFYVIDTLGGCPPYNQINKLVTPDHPDLDECIKLNEKRFSPASLEKIDGVVIMNLYEWFTPKHLEPYLEFLKSAGVQNVLLFGNYFRNKTGMDNLLQDYTSLREMEYYLRNSSELYGGDFDAGLDIMAAKFGYDFLSIKRFACNTNGTCPLFINGVPYSWDKHHFSIEFSRYLSEKMAGALSETWLGNINESGSATKDQ